LGATGGDMYCKDTDFGQEKDVVVAGPDRVMSMEGFRPRVGTG
jgi:hypothetical protein